MFLNKDPLYGKKIYPSGDPGRATRAFRRTETRLSAALGVDWASGPGGIVLGGGIPCESNLPLNSFDPQCVRNQFWT
jgi:hypothetical protein